MNEINEKILKEFIDVCQRIGSDESLVQGSGGNISVKISDTEMIIKTSGTNLKEIQQNNGYVGVNHPQIKHFYQTYSSSDPEDCEKKATETNLKSCLGESSFRPSIETGFHTLLGKIVIHTHPTLTNLITCAENGKEIFKQIFPRSNYIWVPYQSPGYFLTKEIYKTIISNQLDILKTLVLFLENHGLVISTSSFEEGIKLQQKINDQIKEYFNNQGIILEEYSSDLLVPFDRGFLSRNKKLKEFLSNQKNPKSRFIFPDIVVFGEEIFNGEKNEKYQMINGEQIYYQTEEKKAQAINSILNNFLYLMTNLPKIGKIKYLDEEETNYIENMSAEKYRQKINETEMPKIKIIIPMTGIGKRFKDAGYREIKPLIQVNNQPFIEHVVNMFPGENDFIFIVNSDHVKGTEVIQTLKKIKPSAQIVIEEEHKKLGPVYHTLLAGHLIKDEEPVIVCYCDFFMDWDYQDFKKKMKKTNCDGCVISYIGFHPHLLGPDLYGSLLVDENNFMIDYKEKHSWTENKIDCYQSAGAYYFKKGKYIKKYFKEVLNNQENFNGEYYISQPYPLMQRDGLRTYVYEVKYFCQWGTPKDLEEYNFWSRVFQEKAKEPKTYNYWKKFFNKVDWHPYQDKNNKEME